MAILSDLKPLFDLPWLVGGDLNQVFYKEEEKGGPPKSQNGINSFRDAFVNNDIFDLGYKGHDFTWWNGVEDERPV